MKIVIYNYNSSIPFFPTESFTEALEKIESIKNKADYFVFYDNTEFKLGDFVGYCERNGLKDTALQALQNAANNLPAMRVVPTKHNDKRKSKQLYYLVFGTGLKASPELDFEGMNNFLAGMIKALKLFRPQ